MLSAPFTPIPPHRIPGDVGNLLLPLYLQPLFWILKKNLTVDIIDYIAQ